MRGRNWAQTAQHFSIHAVFENKQETFYDFLCICRGFIGKTWGESREGEPANDRGSVMFHEWCVSAAFRGVLGKSWKINVTPGCISKLSKLSGLWGRSFKKPCSQVDWLVLMMPGNCAPIDAGALPIGADEERGGAEEEVSGDRLQGSLRIWMPCGCFVSKKRIWSYGFMVFDLNIIIDYMHVITCIHFRHCARLTV